MCDTGWGQGVQMGLLKVQVAELALGVHVTSDGWSVCLEEIVYLQLQARY